MFSGINRQTVLSFAGYAGFFVFCFVISAYLTFPYERVRDLLVAKVAASSSPPPKLSVGDISPHRFTGLTLHAVTLQRDSAAPGQAPTTTTITLDELSVRAKPFAFLFGGTGVAFEAKAGQGEIGGSYDAKKDGPSHTEVQLDHIDLVKLGVTGPSSLPITGTATGHVDITLSNQAAETQGEIDLHIDGLHLGDAKSDLKLPIPGFGQLSLDPIDAGKLELKIAIKEGVATIEKLEANGKDVELSGSGSVRLVPAQLAQSRADLTLAVKFDKRYAERSERMKTRVMLLNDNPMVKNATGADGRMRFNLTGTLDNPRAVPAGPGAVPGTKGRRAK